MGIDRIPFHPHEVDLVAENRPALRTAVAMVLESAYRLVRHVDQSNDLAVRPDEGRHHPGLDADPAAPGVGPDGLARPRLVLFADRRGVEVGEGDSRPQVVPAEELERPLARTTRA